MLARVLVVEDEEPVRQLIIEQLQGSDYQCDGASNGVEALKLLGQHPYDLVVSDIMMPEKSGTELLKESRQLYPDTAFIMVTARGDVDLATRSMSEGALDYIVKPVKLDDLTRRVLKALEKRCEVMLDRDRQRKVEQALRLQSQELQRKNQELGALNQMVQRFMTERTGKESDLQDLIQSIIDLADRIKALAQRLQQAAADQSASVQR